MYGTPDSKLKEEGLIKKRSVHGKVAEKIFSDGLVLCGCQGLVLGKAITAQEEGSGEGKQRNHYCWL
jgi:hypothetical protein